MRLLQTGVLPLLRPRQRHMLFGIQLRLKAMLSALFFGREKMEKVKFGLIGCGLMGREFASASARWCHLLDMPAVPEVVALCDKNESLFPWYENNFDTVKQVTTDYQELLENDEVDAVYCAVPHNLHEKFYCDIISAGKHLLGEKPFGIDKSANDAIMECIEDHPDVFVRCNSQFPFFPAVQRIGDMLDSGAFGQIIEVNSGFLHSSDLNPDKPINWKRMIEYNGEYGCMGDLGMHACHVPFRAGWVPKNVRAALTNIMTERYNDEGGKVPCETWDNATLLCLADDADGEEFPLTIKTQRIAPGEKNTWYIEIKGTKACARFNTKNPRRLELLEYSGGEQSWQQIDMGYESTYPTITGGIFEFGFSDAMMQMMAAYVYELVEDRLPKRFAGCVTPAETALSHKLFTAALESQSKNDTVKIS